LELVILFPPESPEGCSFPLLCGRGWVGPGGNSPPPWGKGPTTIPCSRYRVSEASVAPTRSSPNTKMVPISQLPGDRRTRPGVPSTHTKAARLALAMLTNSGRGCLRPRTLSMWGRARTRVLGGISSLWIWTIPSFERLPAAYWGKSKVRTSYPFSPPKCSRQMLAPAWVRVEKRTSLPGPGGRPRARTLNPPVVFLVMATCVPRGACSFRWPFGGRGAGPESRAGPVAEQVRGPGDGCR